MSKKSERIILFPGNTVHNDYLPIADFKQMAETALETGFTHVDLGSAMTSRNRSQLDNNGEYCDAYDFYPEFTAAFPDFFKFYCPEALKKVMSTEYTKRNMEELHIRSEILSNLGLKASLMGAGPQFLPEEIYQEHPTWRGPRCDMPFRSRRPYFAPCVDNKEVLALFREASEQIGKAAPTLDTVVFLCIDSGTGLCWYPGLYPGANGPQHCAHIPMEDRIKGFKGALGYGLEINNPDVLVHLTTTPTWSGRGSLSPHPCSNPSQKYYFARAAQDKPVICENPLALQESIEAGFEYEADVLFIGLEQEQILFKKNGLYPALIKECLTNPTEGKTDRIKALDKLISCMGIEEKNKNLLLDAYQDIDHAIDDSATGKFFYNSLLLYSSMSSRLLVRPLLPMPEKMSDDEKMYYHKHVFNSLDGIEIEYDLLHITGLRNMFMGTNSSEVECKRVCFENIIQLLTKATKSLDKLIARTKVSKVLEYSKDMLRRVKALRCLFINLQNVGAFQSILDLAKAGYYQNNVNSESLEKIMRKEMDNMYDLIALFEESDSPLMPLAKNKEDENTFLFGPDIVEQLKKKISLMTKYWYDSQVLFKNKSKYITDSPIKV
jgi:hypothetical protein